MNQIPCSCDSPGLCPVYNKIMSEPMRSICNGTRLTPEKQAAYRQNWLMMGGKYVHPEFCLHRGEQLGVKTCHVCGNRGKPSPHYRCSLLGECTLSQYQVGQSEADCSNCEYKSSLLVPKWDKKIEQLIPATNGQNFNCSIINWQGRKIMAYRHNWVGARVALCELNEKNKPVWNTLLSFPSHPNNVYQEDPRLFIYQNKLHVSYTAVQARPETIAHVGYAELVEDAPSSWRVVNNYLPKYKQRTKWEKNWGFFEAENQLWAVYDTEKQNILSINGDEAKMAFKNDRQVADSFGEIRGGSAPVLHNNKFYSFFHYRKLPFTYLAGCYTFEPVPPFKPIAYIPYPILSPRIEDVPTEHFNKGVVYPCGASLINNTWLVSYGAYDHDCRIAAFDSVSLDNSMRLNAYQPTIYETVNKIIDSCDGWCDKEKAYAVVDLILKNKPKRIVEVGVYGGRFLLTAALACEELQQGTVLGIDPWSNEVAIKEMAEGESKEWWKAVNLEEIYQKFLTNLKLFGLEKRVQIIREDSDKVVPPYSIDLLHIDGSHDEIASRDITRFGKCVPTGGYVILDDLDWATGAPKKGADWLLANGFTELQKLGTGAVYRKG